MIDPERLKNLTPNDKSFEPVEISATVKGAARDPAGGMLFRTGRLVLNNDATDLFDEIVRATPGLFGNWSVAYGANEKSRLVACRAVPAGTPGGSGLRRVPRTKGSSLYNYVMYLHGVFAKHPNLRPPGRCKVRVAADVDREGRLYFEINLQAVQAAPRISRGQQR